MAIVPSLSTSCCFPAHHVQRKAAQSVIDEPKSNASVCRPAPKRSRLIEARIFSCLAQHQLAKEGLGEPVVTQARDALVGKLQSGKPQIP